MKAWWYRLPRAARLVIVFAVVVVMFEATEGPDLTSPGRLVEQLVLGAVVGLVFAALVFLREERLRRDFGSIERFLGYSRALRTGELPTRIEADVWRSWLNRSRTQNRFSPVVACMFLVPGVLLLILVTHPSAFEWAISSLYALLAILIMVSWQVWRRRISRLAMAVEQRAAQTEIH
jgi:membrane protease YdiL (CAAX protease family)